MMDGVRELAKAVKSTLGPRGRNVVIQKQHMAPILTKDGVTVAREVSLKDPFANMGAQILRQAASQTADVAGDGTTTATVLAEAILEEGMKRVVANKDPMSLKRGIDKVTAAMVRKLQDQSREVADTKEIKQVATISANGDQEIGDMIAQAMDEVGKEGVITLEEGKGKRESTLRITTGFEFDRGYLHSAFCNDIERQRVVLENPAVWLINGQVSTGGHMQDMMPVLEHCNQNNTPLLLVTENCEGEVLATIVVNKMRGTLNIAAVKAPGFGSTRKDMLGDLAALTGATLRDQTAGDDILNKASPEELGTAKQVVITKENTVIVGAEGREGAIEERVAQIRAIMEDDLSDWDRERVEKRLAKLVGGVAVIEVGAATEVEMKERKGACARSRCA
jgi:chaperonin GroEL